MTPTPTEEDLRLAHELAVKLWDLLNDGTFRTHKQEIRLLAESHAAFRAEARRETERHVEYLQRQIRLLESGDAATAQKAQQEVEERLQQARLETSRIRQSEREACERIVEEELTRVKNEFWARGGVDLDQAQLRLAFVLKSLRK